MPSGPEACKYVSERRVRVTAHIIGIYFLLLARYYIKEMSTEKNLLICKLKL